MRPDLDVFFFINGFAHRSPVLDAAIIFAAEYLPYLAAAALLAVVVWGKDAAERRMRLLKTAAAAVAAAELFIAEGFKLFYARPRPFVTNRVIELVHETGYSFPSGHATFSFTLATVLYRYDRRMGTIFYALAVLVSLGRVAAGVHYPSDILGDMAGGILVGYLTAEVAGLAKKQAAA